MKKLQIAFIPIMRSTFDIAFAGEMVQQARTHLLSAGFELIELPQPIKDLVAVEQSIKQLKDQPIDMLLIFQATFADSTMITRLSQALNAPLFLWAVPEPWTGDRLRLNSLCGINLAAHALTLQDRKFDFGYGSPQDTDIIEKIRLLALAGAVKRQLRETRLGIVGQHPDGLDSCHLDAPLIKEVFGIEIESIDLHDLFDAARAIHDQMVIQIRQELDCSLSNLAQLDQTALNGTLRVYLALSDLAHEKNLSGLAVRCWPEFFTELGCAACGAMSMLSDGFAGQNPIPCGCEADINGTITQLILQIISGQPAFGTDMVGINNEKGLIALWHCGLAPLSMSDSRIPPRGTIHSNRKLPLLMDFPLKPGGITFARLSRAGGKLRMVIGSGDMIEGPKPFSGTSGLFKPIISTGTFLELLMKEGLEHHISLTYGNFSAELKAIAGVYDLPILWMDSREVAD